MVVLTLDDENPVRDLTDVCPEGKVPVWYQSRRELGAESLPLPNLTVVCQEIRSRTLCLIGSRTLALISILSFNASRLDILQLHLVP